MSNISTNQGMARQHDLKNASVRRGLLTFDAFDRTFDPAKVLRLLGAKRGRRVSAASLRRVDAMAEKLEGMLQPQLGFCITRMSATDRGGIRLADGTCFKSPKLSRALQRAREVCCFIATIGPLVDLEIQRLMQRRRYSEACILDAMGSVAAESVVEQFYQHMARRQGAVTLRFSPGYCDWHLREQRPLFKLFGAAAPDVSLSDSCLMSPRKSVSGLFGLLPPGIQGVHPAHNPCHICNQPNCMARRSN